MKLGRWVAALLGIAAAAAAGPAAAQDKGLYVGGSAGVAQYQESCQDLIVQCDDRDAGWRVFAGYQFSPYISVEAAWADMGKVKFEGDVPGLGPFSQESHVEGYDVVAVVYWPVLNYLSLFGKAGGYRMRVTHESSVGPFPGETSAGFTYGLGAEFRIGGLGLRAEFQRYDNVGGQQSGIDNVHFYSAGLLWRF